MTAGFSVACMHKKTEGSPALPGLQMNSSHCHAESSRTKNLNHSQNPILWPTTFRETITELSAYSHAADSACIKGRGRSEKNSIWFDT